VKKRLAQALKENLLKRKEQMKSRIQNTKNNPNNDQKKIMKNTFSGRYIWQIWA
jgi:hypothetical protein